MKKLISLIFVLLTLTGCNTDAQVASRNLSKDAEMFRIVRRVVFYNSIKGDYILSIEGLCSTDQQSRKLTVTCKLGSGKFKKHFLGLSDNVTYFTEQLNSENVSTTRYKVIFKPLSIIPDIDVEL